MRSFNKKLAARLEAQAQEAQVQGLEKVSNHLSSLLKNSKVREDDDFYVYAAEDLQQDVESHLWQSVARALDYYDCSLNAAEMQPIVQKLAAALVEEVRVTANISHGVGAYEPNVPGEKLERVALEISEDD